MMRFLFSIPLLLSLAGCESLELALRLVPGGASPGSSWPLSLLWPGRARQASEPRVVVEPDDDALIRAEGLDGAFVLLDPVANVLHVSDVAKASAGHVPASTFKIPNTLIGLETGVIPDEHFALRWDGKRRDREDLNRDHDLASAMRVSVLWFYQEIARRIGAERMAHWVSALDYGNRDVSGQLDTFWLKGGLRISPRQQVAFLHRMVRGELPVEPEHVALVLRLIELERQDSTVLRGKTGTMDTTPMTAWLVGVVERGGISYPYATLLLAPLSKQEGLFPLRRELTERLLARHGLWQP